MSDEYKMIFDSFKEASLYAQKVSLNEGKSVGLKRDGDKWAVYLPQKVTNHFTNNTILTNEELFQNNRKKKKTNMASCEDKPNAKGGKIKSQDQVGCNRNKLQPEITVEYQGKNYLWNGKCWYGSDYIRPSKVITAKLNLLAKNHFSSHDASISDFDKLLEVARGLREGGHYSRALNLAKRALKTKPNNDFAATIVCSILRSMNRSEEALKLANTLIQSGSTCLPLLTSRAAALCDLGRWSEALRLIRQVLAKSGRKNNGEALLVWSRIKSFAPHLF